MRTESLRSGCWVAIMCMHVVAAHAQVPDEPATPPPVAPPSAPSSVPPSVPQDETVYRLELRVRGPNDVDVQLLPPPPRVEDVEARRAVPVQAPAAAEPVQAPVADQPAWMEGLKLTPELQLRAREEFIVHPYTGTEGSYTIATRYRARGGLTFERDALTVRLQVQAVGVFGDGLAPGATETALGIHQGYFQLTNGVYWLRLGRQEMAFGDQRMIGVLDWMMSARSFDALRLHAETGKWTVDAFGSVTRAQADYVDPACVLPAASCDKSHSSGDYLGGIYSTWKANDMFATDLYLLYRHDGANADDWQRELDVFSPGARVYGEAGGYLRYKTEGIFQVGHKLSAAAPRRAHQAAALLGELGFELDADATAIMAVGGAYATGQTTGDWTEFENFFPANHKIYGVADLIGLRNLQQEYAMLSWTKASHHLSGFFAVHLLSLATAQGRWTNAPGLPLSKTPVDGNSRFLGSNWDAVIRYAPSSSMFIEAGYSLFAPQAAAERFGKTNLQHFLYVWTEAKLP